MISASPQLIIASDASLKGHRTFCQGHRTRGSWTLLKITSHINVLESKAENLKFQHLFEFIHQFNLYIYKWTMELPFHI